MGKKKTLKKLNNKGFSLVEILIAIIILGIATGPILSCFVTAVRVNAKAKDQQRWNAAAQSIMEGFKGYSFEELTDQFSSSKDNSTDISGIKIYNNKDVNDANGNSFSSLSAAYCTVSTETNSYTSKGTAKSDTVKKGEFYLKGLNYQGNSFDAKVTVDFYDASADGGLNGTQVIEYIQNMSGYNDCVYTEDAGEINTNYYTLLTRICARLNELDYYYGSEHNNLGTTSLGYTPSTLLAMYKSSITVNRTTEVSITDSIVTVKVTYLADVSTIPYYDADGNVQYLSSSTDPASDDYFGIVTEKECFNNTVTGATLDNVFLFVYPAYNMGDCAVSNDTFTISYPDATADESTAKRVFFVKQKNTSITNLLTCEASYNPTITCHGNIYFYHNLNENLGGGSTTIASAPTTTGTAKIIEGIAYDKTQILLYSVTVQIYDSGEFDRDFSGSPKCELTGTMNNN